MGLSWTPMLPLPTSNMLLLRQLPLLSLHHRAHCTHIIPRVTLGNLHVPVVRTPTSRTALQMKRAVFSSRPRKIRRRFCFSVQYSTALSLPSPFPPSPREAFPRKHNDGRRQIAVTLLLLPISWDERPNNENKNEEESRYREWNASKGIRLLQASDFRNGRGRACILSTWCPLWVLNSF